ncbi:MAG: hypothetical protein LIO97_05695 [Tannerellaceae bacterium]|nr:hypothetical protein [Tannerellaceae bacterium]
MKLIYNLFLFLFFALGTLAVEAQTVDSTEMKTTRVHLEHANVLSFDRERNPDAQILNGDVIFRHDSSYMYCDSAYFYEMSNSLEAFSNVRMEQGDTLFVYGNYIFYDGNSQIAYLRENVRMENGEVTLFTDSLNYDRVADIGYYFEGGLIVDTENELSSFYGQYSSATKLAIFNDSVQLDNPEFVLYSDTLHYQTDTKLATILGPSVIVSDSATVYSSRGWYDTSNEYALLLDRSQVVSGTRILTGDSILYNQYIGFGEAFGNMCLEDTIQKVILEGEYGFYNERTEYAFTTDSARFLEFSQGDTLYLHGDTLKMVTLEPDSREITAYYGVRFYRTDLQGVCDSMQFDTRDSVLYMYTEPILWNEEYQIYGDTILIFLNDSAIDYAHVQQFAFAIQQIDSTSYNQLKGNDLKAFFTGNEVRQIDISGNAESIFYPIEDDGTMIGLNQTQSSYLSMWIQEGKLEKLKLWPASQGVLTPIPDLQPDQKTLADFFWFDYIRPLNKDDIFDVRKRKAEDLLKRSNKFVH